MMVGSLVCCLWIPCSMTLSRGLLINCMQSSEIQAINLAPGFVRRYTFPSEMSGRILSWSSQSTGATLMWSLTPIESGSSFFGRLGIRSMMSSSSSVRESSYSAQTCLLCVFSFIDYYDGRSNVQVASMDILLDLCILATFIAIRRHCDNGDKNRQ